MKKPQPYRPHTVLAGGIARLGDALATPAKPTKPNKTMPNPSKPGRPAKPAQAKTLPASEDYSTPYKPPVPVPPVAHAPGDFLSSIQIDDSVPVPLRRGHNGKIELMTALLGKLKVGQSTRLDLQYRCSLQKATQIWHKARHGQRFVIRPMFDNDKTLRIWRVL